MSILTRIRRTLSEEGVRALIEKARSNGAKKARATYWRYQRSKMVRSGQGSVEVWIDSFSTYVEVSYFERNEMKELEDLLREIQETDVFFDVGANIGLYSLFIADYAEEVYAFEPHPSNAHQLYRNSLLNDKKLNIMLCGLSDSSGYASLSSPKNADVDGQVSLSSPGDSPLMTRTESVSSILDYTRTPDVVKIDVEGAEMRVLEGMQDALESDPPRLIFCEVHEDRGVQRTEVSELLKRFDFSVSEFDVIGSRVILKATR